MKKLFIINLLLLLVSGLIAQEGGSGIRNGEAPCNSPPFYLRNSTQTHRTAPNYVLMGFYNTNTKQIDWEIKNKIERASTFHLIFSRAPVIAFSPDGTKGYMADIGDIATGQNQVCQPIFGEFNGIDFSAPPFWININMPALLASYIDGNATCAFDMDMTVDMYGEPHFMAVVGNFLIYSF